MTAAIIRRASFKQSDVTRALKGVEKAGMRVGRVEITPHGKIVIQSQSDADIRIRNEWDDVLT